MFSMISFLFIDEKIGLLDDFSWQQESDPVCWSKNFDILLSVGRFERRVPCFFFFLGVLSVGRVQSFGLLSDWVCSLFIPVVCSHHFRGRGPKTRCGHRCDKSDNLSKRYLQLFNMMMK